MKIFLAISFFLLSFSGYSQSAATKDSSANCVANWKVGETKTYTIIHEKSAIDASGKEFPFRFEYQAQISVIDATPDTYTIKWIFQVPDDYKRRHPRLVDSLPVFDGMQMIFTTSEMGIFLELLNWEEVRDAYIRQMEMSLPKNMDSALTAAMTSAKNMFGTKRMVESALIKEIQLFHVPYGYQFTTTAASADSKLPNPFGGEPFPARQTYQLTSLDKVKDAFTLVFRLTIDKGNLNNIIDPMLKKMNVKDDAEIAKMRKEMTSYDLQDYTEYRFINSTGWISRVFYKRDVSMGETRQFDSYTIELKN